MREPARVGRAREHHVGVEQDAAVLHHDVGLGDVGEVAEHGHRLAEHAGRAGAVHPLEARAERVLPPQPRPVLAMRVPIAVDVDALDAPHAQRARDRQVERVRQRFVAEPHVAGDVRHPATAVRRSRYLHRLRPVEHPARGAPERAVRLPNIVRRQRRRVVDAKISARLPFEVRPRGARRVQAPPRPADRQQRVHLDVAGGRRSERSASGAARQRRLRKCDHDDVDTQQHASSAAHARSDVIVARRRRRRAQQRRVLQLEEGELGGRVVQPGVVVVGERPELVDEVDDVRPEDGDGAAHTQIVPELEDPVAAAPHEVDLCRHRDGLRRWRRRWRRLWKKGIAGLLLASLATGHAPTAPGGRVTNAVGTIFRKIFEGTRARPI